MTDDEANKIIENSNMYAQFVIDQVRNNDGVLGELMMIAGILIKSTAMQITDPEYKGSELDLVFGQVRKMVDAMNDEAIKFPTEYTIH